MTWKESLEWQAKEKAFLDTKDLKPFIQKDKSIYDVTYKKTAIIIGNESKGVSEKLLNIADERIKIPMTGKTESLNAGVATGIIMYEKLRQDLMKL